MDGIIPTGAGNSRIAALRARKRPQVDIDEYGNAVEGGPGGVMLTNRVDSLSDQALNGIQQRGFGSGREAAREAMDAAGRTYRTGRIGRNLEHEQEQRVMDYALADDDALAAQKRGNAVAALETRGKVDVYNDPDVARIRRNEEAQKLALAQAGQAGNVARAEADVYGSDAAVREAQLEAAARIEAERIQAASNEATQRLDSGATGLKALQTLRSELPAVVPEQRGNLLQRVLSKPWGEKEDEWGYRPAQDPAAAQRKTYDEAIQQIVSGLGYAQRPNQPGTLDAAAQPGPPTGQAVADPGAQQRQAVRAAKIKAFSDQMGITPDLAVNIMRKHKMID